MGLSLSSCVAADSDTLVALLARALDTGDHAIVLSCVRENPQLLSQRFLPSGNTLWHHLARSGDAQLLSTLFTLVEQTSPADQAHVARQRGSDSSHAGPRRYSSSLNSPAVVAPRPETPSTASRAPRPLTDVFTIPALLAEDYATPASPVSPLSVLASPAEQQQRRRQPSPQQTRSSGWASQLDESSRPRNPRARLESVEGFSVRSDSAGSSHRQQLPREPQQSTQDEESDPVEQRQQAVERRASETSISSGSRNRRIVPSGPTAAATWTARLTSARTSVGAAPAAAPPPAAPAVPAEEQEASALSRRRTTTSAIPTAAVGAGASSYHSVWDTAPQRQSPALRVDGRSSAVQPEPGGGAAAAADPGFGTGAEFEGAMGSRARSNSDQTQPRTTSITGLPYRGANGRGSGGGGGAAADRRWFSWRRLSGSGGSVFGGLAGGAGGAGGFGSSSTGGGGGGANSHLGRESGGPRSPARPGAAALAAMLSSRNNKGQTPLMLACSHGQATMVALLLRKGADPWAVDPAKGLNALHCAAIFGHYMCAKLLLGLLPASPAAAGSFSRLPDHVLSSGGGRQWLLDARSRSGATPLHYAADLGHTAVVELLLQYGADVSAQVVPRPPLLPASMVPLRCLPAAGATPLHLAARANDTTTALALLRHYYALLLSDNPSIPDPRVAMDARGRRPHQVAYANRSYRLAVLLRPDYPPRWLFGLDSAGLDPDLPRTIDMLASADSLDRTTSAVPSLATLASAALRRALLLALEDIEGAATGAAAGTAAPPNTRPDASTTPCTTTAAPAQPATSVGGVAFTSAAGGGGVDGAAQTLSSGGRRFPPLAIQIPAADAEGDVHGGGPIAPSRSPAAVAAAVAGPAPVNTALGAASLARGVDTAGVAAAVTTASAARTAGAYPRGTVGNGALGAATPADGAAATALYSGRAAEPPGGGVALRLRAVSVDGRVRLPAVAVVAETVSPTGAGGGQSAGGSVDVAVAGGAAPVQQRTRAALQASRTRFAVRPASAAPAVGVYGSSKGRTGLARAMALPAVTLAAAATAIPSAPASLAIVSAAAAAASQSPLDGDAAHRHSQMTPHTPRQEAARLSEDRSIDVVQSAVQPSLPTPAGHGGEVSTDGTAPVRSPAQSGWSAPALLSPRGSVPPLGPTWPTGSTAPQPPARPEVIPPLDGVGDLPRRKVNADGDTPRPLSPYGAVGRTAMTPCTTPGPRAAVPAWEIIAAATGGALDEVRGFSSPSLAGDPEEVTEAEAALQQWRSPEAGRSPPGADLPPSQVAFLRPHDGSIRAQADPPIRPSASGGDGGAAHTSPRGDALSTICLTPLDCGAAAAGPSGAGADPDRPAASASPCPSSWPSPGSSADGTSPRPKAPPTPAAAVRHTTVVPYSAAAAAAAAEGCGVCFEDFSEQQRMVLVAVHGCGHALCLTCARRLVDTTAVRRPPTCPFCRGRITGFSLLLASSPAARSSDGSRSTCSSGGGDEGGIRLGNPTATTAGTSSISAALSIGAAAVVGAAIVPAATARRSPPSSQLPPPPLPLSSTFSYEVPQLLPGQPLASASQQLHLLPVLA